MKGSITRISVCGLALATALTLCAPPAAADTTASPPAASRLTTLSSASLHLIESRAPAVRASKAAQDTGSDSRSFFRSKKGAAALVLVGAGIGLAWWAHKDSREEVRSPIRD